MRAAIPAPTDPPPWAWRVVVRTVLWFFHTLRGWRWRGWGPEREIPRDRGVVAVFNHTSNVDPFFVADTVLANTGRWVRPLAKAELFDVPVLGWLGRNAGGIPVARDSDGGREQAYAAAEAALADGHVVLLAPEGTVTHDGTLLPLRHGAARLAIDAGADVLVVTHFGAQRAFSPVVTFPSDQVAVTLTLDLLRPTVDETPAQLTGRIALTMLERAEGLRDAYPQQDRTARWWPPYREPADPTGTARKHLEQYRESMAETIAEARERVAALREPGAVEEALADARERARARVEGLREQAHDLQELGHEFRQRAEHLLDELREELRDELSNEDHDLGERVRAVTDDLRGALAELASLTEAMRDDEDTTLDRDLPAEDATDERAS